MRIAIAGIAHETNTYCRDATPLDDFHIATGEQILRARGTDTQVGGALGAMEELDATPVPILVASTQPSGTITRDAYETLEARILQGIAAAMPVDGVYLDLHGAGVADGHEDLEGDLAWRVRELVGPDIPVTASFDLHGNISQRMADALDGVFACHQYPHIDVHLRAAEAVHLIARMQRDGVRPVTVVRSLPLLMPTTTTFEGPGAAMLTAMLAAESRDDGIIDVSWFHGFPYADTPQAGSHVAVTTSGDRQLAERIATQMASELWNARESFRPTSLSADEAVRAAQGATARPVVINETSDNTGGGSPGDGTHLLRAMLAAGLDNACFGFIVDAESAAAAHRAGVGATIEISLGGHHDDLHGEPLPLTAYVKALHDGRLTMEAMFRGAPLNLGPMARLVVDDFDILVASRRSQTFDRQPFLALGIDPAGRDFVALKSSNHFRAGFTELAGTIITADPPGLTTHHIEIFARSRNTVPLWPVDEDASFTA